nr:hypothetical protein [Carbonactinospora thermoautotrophica]
MVGDRQVQHPYGADSAGVHPLGEYVVELHGRPVRGVGAHARELPPPGEQGRQRAGQVEVAEQEPRRRQVGQPAGHAEELPGVPAGHG